MTSTRCFHDAVLAIMDARLRDAMQSRTEVDIVLACVTCRRPCKVWLYYDGETPLLMVKEEVRWGEIDYYSWTGTEWWED